MKEKKSVVFYKAQLMVSKLIQGFPWMEIAEFDPSWLKNLNCLSFDLMFLLFVLKSTKMNKISVVPPG